LPFRQERGHPVVDFRGAAPPLPSAVDSRRAVESQNANKINYRGYHGARAGSRPVSKPLAEQGQEELD
jgi:hypothetical protein